MPFVTGWMGENHWAPIPTAAYGVVLLMAAVAFTILQRVLVADHSASRLARAVRKDRREWVSLAMYASAIPLAFVNQWISDALYVGVALLWLVPDRRIESVIGGEAE